MALAVWIWREYLKGEERQRLLVMERLYYDHSDKADMAGGRAVDGAGEPVLREFWGVCAAAIGPKCY